MTMAIDQRAFQHEDAADQLLAALVELRVGRFLARDLPAQPV